MHVFLVLVRWNKDERRELNSSAPHINLSTRFHVRGGNTNSINNLASRLIWKKQNSGYEFTDNSWLHTCVDSHFCYLMAVYTLSIYTKFMYENFCLLILQEARYDAVPHKFYICKIQVHSSTSELNATTSEKYKFTPKKSQHLVSLHQTRMHNHVLKLIKTIYMDILEWICEMYVKLAPKFHTYTSSVYKIH